MVHYFCGKCGNTVAVFSEAGNFYTVSVSTLEDSERFSPQMSIYARSAAKWATFPKDVPIFDTIPPSMGG
ncbi:Glutathione-dependent formaldehyde-activating enzyme [Thalassotalea agarivorans]|uniref:Glutathione-dependent formaldehyde-activating enzyme n=2 Tax=Thalassotalea agarivorans TaxID=349064 RepID=A0A1I0EXW0_THASX|nr:Glutathione-dependent formaldehyde-activating enzyme [Thalassotalea agarivorans]